MKTCKRGHEYEPNKKKCSICNKIATDKWQSSNKERIKNNKRKWYQDNRESEILKAKE